MVDIVYHIGNHLYLNITNQCPCRCDFCIRGNGESVGSADNLWFEQEPTLPEMIEAFDRTDLSGYTEIIFCGYGEPIVRLEELKAFSKHIRSKTDLPIRINTNGLGDLIHDRKVAQELKGVVDAVSISLNAANARNYQKICHSEYGERSYEAMLQFTRDCLQVLDDVTMTVVDFIEPDEIEQCRKIAGEIGAKFRVRHWAQ